MIIDLRPPQIFSAKPGHIRGAANIPLGRLAREIEKFDPREGFVLSRVNGEWDVQSILKICPMPEEEALLIFARLFERKVIELL